MHPIASPPRTLIPFALAFLILGPWRSSDAIRIPCGKAFLPCPVQQEEGSSPYSSAPTRLFGLPNSQSASSASGSSLPLRTLESRDTSSVHISDPILRSTVAEAQAEVDVLFDEQRAKPMEQKNVISPAVGAYNRMHAVSEKAKRLSEPAYLSTALTTRLKKLGLSNADLESPCLAARLNTTHFGRQCPKEAVAVCAAAPYRTLSGHCNNVAAPLSGMAQEPLQRLGRPAYADGISLPRRTRGGQQLPNARQVSLELFFNPSEEHPTVTALASYWLYFIGSDIALLAPNQFLERGTSTPLPCCVHGFAHADCDAIDVMSTDPVYGPAKIGCLPYARTLPVPRPHCQLGAREQSNQASSFLDASPIYGSSLEDGTRLRAAAGDTGRLLTSSFSGQVDLLPLDQHAIDYCQSPTAKRKCFQSGSSDSNLLPSITALHTLWARQHNKVADALKEMNRHWSGEKIFEEARRIIIAQLQHITYNEFLPVILGQDLMREFGLAPLASGYSSDYDMELSGAALNEFATLVVPVALSWLSARSQREMEQQGFNNPDRLYEQGGFDAVMKELVGWAAERPGLKMAEQLRGGFLASRGAPGLDVVAIALKQERDHGLPSYMAMRRRCGLPKIQTFNELAGELVHEQLPDRLATVYESVEDVDLLVGVMAERPRMGSFVGATLACILAHQFQRAKRSDRFWYENFIPPSAFNEQQLAEIRKSSLARLMCDHFSATSKTEHSIQLLPFMKPDAFENFPISCDSHGVLLQMDMSAWRDAEVVLQLPVTQDTIRKVFELAALNLKDQRRRESNNIQRNQLQFHRGDPLFAYASMMRAKKESKMVAKISDLLLESTRIIVRGDRLVDGEKLPALDVESLQRLLPDVDVSTFIANYTAFLSEDGRASVEECLPRMLPCDHTSRYRTFSGWCNNLKNPHYANSFTSLRHLMPPVYDDGFDAPRIRARSGNLLPSPRRISNAVHVDREISHVKFTHMVMQFGQLLDHELTHSPVSRGPNDEILNCTRCDSPKTISVHCMPIRVDADDPFFPTNYPNGEPRCLPFARSLLGQLTLGYRNQINQITAYIDGSAIYGSTLCESNNLRLFRKGMLNFTDLGEVNRMGLPQGSQEKDCRSLPAHPCFVAGDERNKWGVQGGAKVL